MEYRMRWASRWLSISPSSRMLSGSPGTSAGELTRITGLSASATSQHLARMRDEGLIDSQRDAQRILYSIKNEAVNAIIATLKNVYCP
ncbi:ArsR/SmtB family transcription factor [Escherichia coli]